VTLHLENLAQIEIVRQPAADVPSLVVADVRADRRRKEAPSWNNRRRIRLELGRLDRGKKIPRLLGKARKNGVALVGRKVQHQNPVGFGSQTSSRPFDGDRLAADGILGHTIDRTCDIKLIPDLLFGTPIKGSEVPFKFVSAMASHFQCIY
jgi:hypothetical protein